MERGKLYTVLIILVLITLIISLIQYLSNRKWTLLYTAFGAENYFGVIGKLKTAGINYKSKSPINLRSSESRFIDNTQYDIYVKREVEHLAYEALQKNN
jgi:hypothetical protein